MFAVTTGAVPGSSVKCGLPEGWTSPSERSTAPVRIFSTARPRTGLRSRWASRAAAAGLPLLSMTGSIQAVLVEAVAHQDLGALDQQDLAGTDLQIVRDSGPVASPPGPRPARRRARA
jgi:hypothetical protein